MSVFLGILLTFLILLIVVMIHELGHFVAARLTKMKVEEFGIGIPPRAKHLHTDKKGTIYTLNWLPVGGFVRIFGEDAQNLDGSPHTDAFISKNWISRVLVLFAGVFMNFVLAFCIFVGLFWFGVAPMTVTSSEGFSSRLFPSFSEAIKIGYLSHSGVQLAPLAESIASRSGIGSGDVLISIEHRDGSIVPIHDTEQVINTLRENQTVILHLTGTGGEYSTSVMPQDGKIGAILRYKNLTLRSDFLYQNQGLSAITAGWHETIATTRMTVSFLARTLQGLFIPKTTQEHQEATSALSGPIGLGSTFIDIVREHAPIHIILIMIAMLSINLGVVNILPFPALDGGRIITTTLYSICSYFPHGKKYFTLFEGYIHTFGFVVLLGLMLYVAGLDISRFF